jgi:hypothetical protein
MPLLSFGSWVPDVADYEGANTQTVQNVCPRADGYGPFPSLAALSLSLGAQCRGAFDALNTDGSSTIFAATSTDLYVMNNTTFAWSKVSLSGGPYSALSVADQWRFAQFNSLVIAVQANVAPQVWTLGSSSAFANLAGSPPQARYIDVVGRFVVLSGLLSNPFRVQWSGLNDVNGSTSWTAGINSSDFQDLPDGGFVRGVAGGENGVILQDTAIRTMTYVAGSPIIFQIERISQDKGLFGPYSLVRAGERIFFFSAQGFHRIDPGGLPVPIGRERVDRTFLADLDTGNLQMFVGVADPKSSRILWAYKSVNGTANQFDKMLVYDWVLDKFTPVKISGEYPVLISQPGVTLEALDALAPGAMAITGAANNGSGLIRIAVAATGALIGRTYLSIQGVVGTTEANGNWFFGIIDATHIDLIAAGASNTVSTAAPGSPSAFVHTYVSGGTIGGSLDAMTQSLDTFAVSTPIELAAFDASHVLNFFRGPSLEATLNTSEQGTDGTRMKERSFRPITDAATVYGSISYRDTTKDVALFTPESLINAKTGKVNVLKSTRYSRTRCRIPAGTAWTFIAGVEPDSALEGKR